jgi:hypothetical protein
VVAGGGSLLTSLSLCCSGPLPRWWCLALLLRCSCCHAVPRSSFPPLPLPFPHLSFQPLSSCPSFTVAIPSPFVTPTVFLSLVHHFPLSHCCALAFRLSRHLPVPCSSFPPLLLLFPRLSFYSLSSCPSLVISIVIPWPLVSPCSLPFICHLCCCQVVHNTIM